MRDILSPLSGFPTPWVRCRGSIAAPAWTPAALFTGPEIGAWYDPSDLSTLVKDTFGAPVTSDGDPVHRMFDKSGHGITMQASTTNRKPIYRTNGTLHWLETDGVDDDMISFDLGSSTTAFQGAAFLSCVGAMRLQSGGGIIPLRNGQSVFAELLDDGGNDGALFRNYILNPSAPGVQYGLGSYSPRVIAASSKPTESKLQVDANAPIVKSVTVTGSPSPQYFRIHSVGAPAMRFYGGVVVMREEAPGEFDNLRAYMAAKTGVAL